jgi:hypothetical protein
MLMPPALDLRVHGKGELLMNARSKSMDPVGDRIGMTCKVLAVPLAVLMIFCGCKGFGLI